MCLAAKKLACARAADEFSSFDHGAPAREDSFWGSFDLSALEHRIVHAHVMGFCADDLLFVRIKDHEVGIRPYSDSSFAGIEAEEFCGSGGHKLDEAVGGKSFSVDAPRIDEAEAVLDAGAAVGNFCEVVFAQFLLLLETKRAVVR